MKRYQSRRVRVIDGKPQFTEVQVRIHNTQGGAYHPLEIRFEKLPLYLTTLMAEPKDRNGNPNSHQFKHLPLVSFVDVESGEECVFRIENDLPKEPTVISTTQGKLIANLTA